jgi:Uma2 family endonuclease
MSPTTASLLDGPLTWDDVLHHPALQDLPFKIELNERGQIVMSPASNKHSRLQGRIGYLLQHQLDGEAFPECSIDTPKGTKVADVVWASQAFIEAHGYETPYRKAPEICVEIVSPSNAAEEMNEKITLYLAKGAQEVWLCDLDGKVAFYSHEGEIERSVVAPAFPVSV